MKNPPPRWPAHVFRIFSLLVPPAVVWELVFFSFRATELDVTVVYAITPLWIAVAAGFLFRAGAALTDRRRNPDPAMPSFLERVDVLTSSGCATAWIGSAAVASSVRLGWASLSVLGLLGLSVLYLAVLWTFVRAGGSDPWRASSLSRRFVPAVPTEGEAMREVLLFENPFIPAGFRLLASGRIGERWLTFRHALESPQSNGETTIETDVGLAIRGEHQVEPVALWLEDVLGLTRSVCRRAGATTLTVLPRVEPVAGLPRALSRGGYDRMPRAARQVATEGCMHLREYAPGDDARRIHWIRSLAAREIVVRLPDEVPPDRPAVKLVLDTYFPGASDLTGPSPDALLDAMVMVWLSVGRGLLEMGSAVTLVTAAPVNGAIARVERSLATRAMQPALHLGARVTWQEARPARTLLDDEPSILVSCRPLWERPEDARAPVLVVSPRSWVPAPARAIGSTAILLPYPRGAPDNRGSRRRRERRRHASAQRDYATLLQLTRSAPLHAGSFFAVTLAVTLAVTRTAGEIRLEAAT